MTRAVLVLPEGQAAALATAYDQSVASRRRQLALSIAITAAALAIAAYGAEVDPHTFWSKLGNFTSYFNRLLTLDTGMRVWTDPAEWFWGVRRWSRLLGETLLIAYVGTLGGAVLAFVGCFLASRNLIRSAVLRMVTRRVLELLRTVPDIVFAMIFVVAFGLGALPGVLALTLHSAGSLGKLFTEVVESVDMRPVEGVTGAGGSWFARVRFGVLPQVLSHFASYALLRLEWNVRGAAVIGFVGAGGIGTDLLVAIRKFFYADVSAMLLMIVACVMLLDVISERLRHRLLAFDIGSNGAASVSQTNRFGIFLAACAVGAFLAGLYVLDVTPARLLAGVGRLTDIVLLMLPPTPGSLEHFRTYIAALGETLAIAFLGTACAALFALPLGFIAARNVVTSRVLHFLARRALDAVRSVDTLVWALIWINVCGLGPFAGALAIASTDMAALAKLMSEAIETASKGPMDGLRAVGGGRLAVMRFGILPQVLPVFASQCLYFFESNTRSATIIGIVGAGGIGLYLSEMIRVLEWREAAFLILLVLIAVAVIDAISRRLRAAIMGTQAR